MGVPWEDPADVKLSPFDYSQPTSIAEAVDLMRRLPDAKVLAGGQSLLPILALRMGAPANLVDIRAIGDLSPVEESEGWLRVGAGIRQSELQRHPGLANAVPLLSVALPAIGHRAIRNRGTVCGSLAHADPAAELPAVAVTLGAELEIAGPRGQRTVAADDFFQGHLSTVIGEDELLVEARFPLAPARQGAAVAEASRRHGDFAVVGVAGVVELDGTAVSRCRLTAFGVDGVPRRLAEVEAVVTGSEATDTMLDEAGETARRSVEPGADDHGSTAYKQQLTAVMTRRCLTTAVRRAQEVS